MRTASMPTTPTIPPGSPSRPVRWTLPRPWAQGAIYAADCVEDHVFTIDSSARFCVAPLNDLENQTYIETLSLPSNALDMAYNYADGKLYVLCTQNRLYSIDPLMGTLEMVGTIPMSAGLSFMTLACATDGTFYAATYSDYNSRLYKSS